MMVDMITTLIFSKDRACQLDFLIRSLNRHAEGKMQLNILYAFSDSGFESGYKKLIEKFPEINFIHQTSFKADVINIISKAKKYACFLTDDDVMFGDFDVSMDDVESLFEEINPMSLSLRLGRNTIVQDPYLDLIATMPRNITIFEDKFMVWDIKSVSNFEIEIIDNQIYNRYYACNFAMPVSLDGHLYKKKYLLPILKNISYYCPNSMEIAMSKAPIRLYPTSMLSCPLHSIVVNSPNNKIQDTVGTMAGEKFSLPVEELNQQFLEGKVLDLDRIYDFDIRGCHQELNLEMV